MSYLTQSQLAGDMHILNRVTACVSREGDQSPTEWAAAHMWQLSAEPGWDAAYASALASGDENPGANESAVTDGMILAAVQAIRAAETEPEEEAA